MLRTHSPLIKTVRFAALFLLIGCVAFHQQTSRLLQFTSEVAAQSLTHVNFDAYIKNNAPSKQSYSFGYPMAISGDTLAVGEVDGIAIFRRTTQGTWEKETQLTVPINNVANNYWYGNPNGIALDGDRLLVGDPQYNLPQDDNEISRAGTVHIYERDSNNSWHLQGQLFAPISYFNTEFGFAVDLSGNIAIVSNMGGSGSGNIRQPASFTIFERNQEGQWIQQFHKEGPGTNISYGFDVAIDQDLVAISNLQGGDFLSHPYSSNVVAHQRVASQQTTTYVEVYRRTGSTWALESTLYSQMANTFDKFGYSLDIDDGTIVVGAPSDQNELFGVNPEISLPVETSPQLGAAYIFEQASPSDWSKVTYLKANSYDVHAAFGNTVAIDGNKVLVGAPYHSDNQNDNPWNYQGAANLFVKTADGWQDSIQILAPNPNSRDYFGYTAVLAGDLIAIGALNEASGATGINGDQQDNSAPFSGAVYTFVIEDNTPPDNGENPPDNGSNPPDNGGTPPDNGGNPPDNGETPPDEGENPPDNGSNPPDEGENPVQEEKFLIYLPSISR
jgi:hypothetical protein